jgi:protein-S-isoprenylcysteine O-methyltransferase Ste14
MMKQLNWPSLLLPLLALAVVYGVGSTFFTVELENLLERTLTTRITQSPMVSDLSHELYSGVDEFMASNHVQLIGYGCLALMILAGLVGLMARKSWLASLGSFGLILPVYAYFILHMSFLAGLGVVTVLWAPFWGELVRLGDIVYLPYMAVVYPASLLGVDIRITIAALFADLGLAIFILGVLAWFYARLQEKDTADFWLYRYTRHPQYLGWVLWSYGLMLRVGLRRDTAFQAANPGASLLWVISTLIIICVALSEEVQMQRRAGSAYENYRQATPFFIPLPGFLGRTISAPFRWVTGKAWPENGWDLVKTFVVYLVLVVLLSFPLVAFDFPPSPGWMQWPF